MLQTLAARLSVFVFCAPRQTSVLKDQHHTQGTAPMYVIDISEEQINIKIMQTVEEKFPVIYDYSFPGHSNKEVDKAWYVVNMDGKCTHAPC
jgi:hypothetical protein